MVSYRRMSKENLLNMRDNYATFGLANGFDFAEKTIV